MLTKSISTARSILKNEGVRQVARVSLEKAGIWWRHGNPLELGKLVGRPSPVARVDGCRFGLDAPIVTDDLRYLLLSGKHEKPERTLIRRYLDPELALIELGGALGVVSCIANRLLRHPERHVVVEANPALVPLLVSNRSRNRCRFAVLNRAVAYRQRVARFHVNANVLASSVGVPDEHGVDVPATTLQQILEQHDFGRCTLICDIEGAEVELVRHESSVLSAHVKTLIMEVHDRLVGPEVSNHMLQTLNDVGFRVLDRAWDSFAFANTRF